MLSDYVETVIRVIEGTIQGRRNYSYMEGNRGPANKRTRWDF